MRLLGHPVHPMLVHFPIVFWSCAIVADVTGLFAQATLAAPVAFGALALGCASGLLALRGYPPTPVSFAALLASAAGFLTMAYGAWLGGKLVYGFGVGVTPGTKGSKA